jgi:hypothetical protein
VIFPIAWGVGNLTLEDIVNSKELELDDTRTYLASKGLSEKRLWRIAEEHPEIDVTTGKTSTFADVCRLMRDAVLPPTIYGPYAPGYPLDVIPKDFGASNGMLYQIITGGSKGPGSYPDYLVSQWVDVRDVARAHILPLESEFKGGKKRLLVEAPTPINWKDVTLYLREKRPELVPRLPSDATLAEPLTMSNAKMDTSHTEKVLGVKKEEYYTGWKKTVEDTIDMFLAVEKLGA